MASRRIRVKWRYDGALQTSRARARTAQAAAQVPCAPKQRKFSEALLRPWLTRSPSKREWQALFGQNSFGSEGGAVDRITGHGKESLPTFGAIRFPDPIRVISPSELPTDHDYAVSTRRY